VSSLELLKEQARNFEQDEKWENALDLYSQAIDMLSHDDEPDITLFNRSGDLATKLGSADQAVRFYEKAVDAYVAEGLHNNAIAVCKKVLRNLPDRHRILLKMGQIRAAQGFITDARTNFISYAEHVQADGDLDEAFRALIEYVKLAPDDYEVCMLLAAQLDQNGRSEEAISQYVAAFRIMRRQGLDDLSKNVAAQIAKLDPTFDLELAASREGEAISEDSDGSATAEDSSGQKHEPDVVGPIDLPLLSFDDEEAAPTGGDETPAETVKPPDGGVGEKAAEAVEKAAEEAAAATAAAEREAAEASTRAAAEREAAEASTRAAAEREAAEASARAAVEREAAEAAARAAAEKEAADAAAEKASEGSAVAPPEPESTTESPSEPYVDLSTVLLGGASSKEEKSTRFVVPFEEPTGDDEADFTKMLVQFREKVSENIDTDDTMAHYDLGTAYMEMGLLDEAIAEYQMVLRGTSDDLPTYEMLGQTFLRKEEPEAAIRSLTRALAVPCDVEDELVGIYYYIGLANEKIGDKTAAVEFYDRVFALDINFADVTDRLRALRA
jgi:tetratricopeptide (TPR) repeat protein